MSDHDSSIVMASLRSRLTMLIQSLDEDTATKPITEESSEEDENENDAHNFEESSENDSIGEVIDVDSGFSGQSSAVSTVSPVTTSTEGTVWSTTTLDAQPPEIRIEPPTIDSLPQVQFKSENSMNISHSVKKKLNSDSTVPADSKYGAPLSGKIEKPPIYHTQPEKSKVSTPLSTESDIKHGSTPISANNNCSKPLPHSQQENQKVSVPLAPIQQKAEEKPSCSTAPSVMVPPTQTQRPKLVVIVNNKQYQVLNMLGKGGSSKVYQVYDESGQKCLAVKIVDLSDADELVRRAYENEIKLLQRLQKSDRVVRLYDFELRESEKKLYVVMEKGDTDLSTFLKGRRNEPMADKLISFYWLEMLRAVQIIHMEGIVHSDLKPSNFLLVGGNLKLIDFGIASTVPNNKTSITIDCQMGTLNYMSPEAIKNAGHGPGDIKYKIPLKSDIWSLGCILYNMVYGKTPFQHITHTYGKMLAITDSRHKIEFKPIKDQHLLDVIKRCLSRDPKLRPSVDDLLIHPYLENNENKGKLRQVSSVTSSESKSKLDESQLLSLGQMLGHNTPRTNAKLLKQVFGQVQQGKQLTFK